MRSFRASVPGWELLAGLSIEKHDFHVQPYKWKDGRAIQMSSPFDAKTCLPLKLQMLHVVALRDRAASSLERLSLRQDAQPMSTDVQAPASMPQGAAQRIVLVLAIVLVPTVPIVAFNVAIVAAAVTALRRSRAWRWYLLIAALAWVLLMIDPTPFGVGEFRSSEGEVF